MHLNHYLVIGKDITGTSKCREIYTSPGTDTGQSHFERMDRSMCLKLSMSETGGSLTDVYEIHGQGADGVGTFFIDGHVKASGEIWFEKRYVGHHWLYRGRVLPWGIAGRWDEGPFWLWKAS